MSRRTQRAVAIMLLHQQMMGGRGSTVPPAIMAELMAAAPPVAWYLRAWYWLRDRYNLAGWQEP